MDAPSRASARGGWTFTGSIVGAWCALAVTLPAAADEPQPVPAFQPGEISIGEPIALPAGGAPPATAAARGSTPTDDPQAALPAAPATGAAVPGSGWLGLAVAESSVPGRWRIEEVTPGGPAARAGIAAGDELRAVNGVPLESAEEVSEALTAIGAGQDVRVAVARADRVSDVVLRAETRPAPRVAAQPQGQVPTQVPAQLAAQVPAQSPAPLATPAPPATVPPAAVPPATVPAAAPAPFAATPSPGAIAPATIAAAPTPAPAANPDWQAARTDEPASSASRFGRSAAELPGPVPAPSPVTIPPAVAATPSAALPTPDTSATPAAPSPPGRIALGVRTVPIDPALQARFALDEPVGAYVYAVVEDLPAAKAGVPPGSVIVALGDQPVRSPVELTRLVTGGPVDRPVTVQFVMPGGETRKAAVVLAPLDPPLEQALTGGLERVGEPPALQAPVPRRADRRPTTDDAIRTEIRGLRARLDRLERLLLDLAPGGGR